MNHSSTKLLEKLSTRLATPTKIDLPEGVRTKMVDLLNDRLADAIDLQTQCKQAHWNVKGPNFYQLHLLFDQVNEAVEEYVDTIGERAVQLGGIAVGTARAVAERSTLKEYPLSAKEGLAHVQALSAALAAFGKNAREAIDISEKAGDADTCDAFTEISRGTDKWLWFVESHLHAAH